VRRWGGAVLGEVLEDLLKRSEAALEVGHSGIGDAKEAVLADRILKELGDVGGELADRLVLVAPRGDGEARCAGPLAGRDRPCGIDVLGFVPAVASASGSMPDGSSRCRLWTTRESLRATEQRFFRLSQCPDKRQPGARRRTDRRAS
jgi:hypothetical protein